MNHLKHHPYDSAFSPILERFNMDCPHAPVQQWLHICSGATKGPGVVIVPRVVVAITHEELLRHAGPKVNSWPSVPSNSKY